MMYLKYLCFAPILIFLNILAILLSPIFSLYSVWKNVSVLPYPFNLFHTHDDDLDGGQHQLNWPKVKGSKLWLQRMLWICRNPGYGFAAEVFGFETGGVKYKYLNKIDGDFDTGKTVKYKVLMYTPDGKKYFSYRRDQHLFGKRYIKIWLGWNYVAYGGRRHQLKTMFNPFKKAEK